MDDGEISDNVFDVSIGYSADGPFTMVLTDIPSNKDRSETLQQFKISRLARYVKIEASNLGSGSLHISEVTTERSLGLYPFLTILKLVARRACGVEPGPFELKVHQTFVLAWRLGPNAQSFSSYNAQAVCFTALLVSSLVSSLCAIHF